MITSSASAIASNKVTTPVGPSPQMYAERKCEKHREDDERKDVSVGGGGNDIVGNHALEELGNTRK